MRRSLTVAAALALGAGTVCLSSVRARGDEAPLVAAAPAEHHEHEQGSGKAPTPATNEAVAAGKQVFAQNCAGCHGMNAEGKVGPRLVGTPHSPAEIRMTVTNGRPPKMPPFKDKLTAAQIESVAVFVRSLGPPSMEGHEHEGHDHAGDHHGAMAEGHEQAAIAGREMQREGSGTSWLPESSPMWAQMTQWGSWHIMQHGNAILMYDAQGGPRGVSRAVSTNWYMLMGSRPLANGELMLRTMLSLEPATIGNNGQPQLFQTGEGTLDRQHPHDLFMEIAAQYSRSLGNGLSWYLYAAPVGEPALGPTAFMHRVSAMDNPMAPLIHHWTDSTHISYGVLTAGIQSKKLKLEGSWFNGHEPDGQRWAIDPLALNSVSGRINYAPNKNWVFQVSHGKLDNPEANYPKERQGDVERTTASFTYNRSMEGGNWATTFAWGHNSGAGRSSNGFLLESNYLWRERNSAFARIERVNKDELFLDPNPRADRQFMVNAFSLGYARDVVHNDKMELALGAMATVYAKSSALDRAYGDFPASAQVFLRLRPGRIKMGHEAHNETAPPSVHMHHPQSQKVPCTRLAAYLARELAQDTGKL